MDGARLGDVIALQGSPCAAPEFSIAKVFRKGQHQAVWLSPVSAKSAFLGRSDDVRRHHQAFAL